MLQEGKIVDSGTPKELVKKYGRSNMEEVFLDVARGRQIDNIVENWNTMNNFNLSGRGLTG